MLQYTFRSGAPVIEPTSRRSDQPWLVYSPLPTRPKLRWPNNARVALWVCPCFVFYEFVPEPDRWLNAWARTSPPDVMGYARQEYGNRVGFWRMLEVLDKYEIKCTAVVNSEALARFPDVTDAIKQRKWAIAGHGRTNTQFVYGYTKEEERRYYREMLDTVKALTGVTMLGMGGAGPQAAPRPCAPRGTGCAGSRDRH